MCELQSRVEACPGSGPWSPSRPKLSGRERVAKPRQGALGPRKRLAEVGYRGVQVAVFDCIKPNGSSFILSHLWMASPLPKSELVNDCEIFVFRLRPGGIWQVRSR